MGIEIKATALNSYFTIRKHLRAFIEEKFHTSDITFSQIEEDFLDCLQHYSVGKLGHSQGHYRKMALAVKKVCRLAYREGVITRLLFAHVTIERGENKQPRALDRASLDKLQSLPFESRMRWSWRLLATSFSSLAIRVLPTAIWSPLVGRISLRMMRGHYGLSSADRRIRFVV